MFLRDKFEHFVTLNDVTQQLEEYNPVIYNPGKDDILQRRILLARLIKEHVGIELTHSQLYHLTCYDVDNLEQFVFDLRDIIIRYKESQY